MNAVKGKMTIMIGFHYEKHRKGAKKVYILRKLILQNKIFLGPVQ